jgi:hypothetical protein
MEIIRYASEQIIGRFKKYEMNLFDFIEHTKSEEGYVYGYEVFDIPIKIIIPEGDEYVKEINNG